MRAAGKDGTTGMRGALNPARFAIIEMLAGCGSQEVARSSNRSHTVRRVVMRNAINSLMLVAVGLFQVIVIASMLLGR